MLTGIVLGWQISAGHHLQTQGRAGETSGFPTSEACYCTETRRKVCKGYQQGWWGGKRLLEDKSIHFTSLYVYAKKPEAAALYPAERSSFSPQSPLALHEERIGTSLFYLHLPVAPNFHPDYFLVVWLFACLAIITIPASLWHLNV